MRSYLPDYALREPETLAEALQMLSSEPRRWRPFAGGTDLMVLLESGALTHREFVSLWRLRELRRLDIRDREVVIGALTTYSDVLRDPVMQREFPLICQAARETGSVATQNRGTIGGNIANASPAADTPPALLVYDAELDLTSTRGTRRVPYERFHRGYKVMELEADELITAIRLPRRRQAWRETFRKVGTRRAQAISKVCFAAGARVTNADLRGSSRISSLVEDVRIALGSVAPTVIRARTAETVVRGHVLSPEIIASACNALAEDIAPIDDLRSSARYRREVAKNLLRDWLSAVAVA
jgi:CO/xanthine dehydrogenase FAD-binding subunit